MQTWGKPIEGPTEAEFCAFKFRTIQANPDMVNMVTLVCMGVCVYKAYLAVCVDDRAQKLPGASSSIHAHHAQNLQETQAPQEWGGEDVALAPRWHHRQWSNQYYDVWRVERQHPPPPPKKSVN